MFKKNSNNKTAKNGSLLNYFKPSQASTPVGTVDLVDPCNTPPSRVSVPAPGSVLSSPSRTPRLLSSAPKTPKTPSPLKISNIKMVDAVIEASDDDGFSSDSSLEDILSLRIEKKNQGVPPQPARLQNPCVTPKAKRPALYSAFQSSPVTPQATKRELDMAALIVEARRGDELNKFFSASNAEDSNLQGDELSRKDSRVQGSVMEAMHGKDESDVRKVMKAIERTDASSSVSRYYFFKDETKSTVTSRRKFPETVKGHWRLLASDATREQHVASGLHQTVMRKSAEELPDDIFHYMLNMVCLENSALLRDGCLDMIQLSPKAARRLVDCETINDLFQQLDASTSLQNLSSPVDLCEDSPDRYLGRDWSRTISTLNIFAKCAPYLEFKVVLHTLKILLRMTADHLLCCDPEVLAAQSNAVEVLTQHVQQDDWPELVSCIQAIRSTY